MNRGREPLPQRGNPAAGVKRITGAPTIVFLTVATKRRAPWLAAPEVQRLLVNSWQHAKAWMVGDYILMPDHLHCFCTPADSGTGIERWIAYWKHVFQSQHKRPDWRWQSRGWHHRLRSNEDFNEKWNYLRHNPVRAGLVPNISEWPYQGRVFDFGLVSL
jgi:putative transposase